ncbi:MAG: hypothetical protein QOF53_1878 [Nocardioidaceae bacterium]|nr:hypothetical protein [Nocardioidaceae bacterium]
MSVSSLGSASEPEASVVQSVTAEPAVAADLHVVADTTSRRRGYEPALLVGAGLLAAAVVAFVAGAGTSPWVCAAAWPLATAVSAAAGRWRGSAAARARSDLRRAGVLGSLVCLTAVAGVVPLPQARWSVAAVAAGLAATLAVRVAQPRRTAARRVVLVGAQQDVEAYSADARGTGVVVAGCHIVDAGSALAVPAVVGVPTTTSLETLADLVADVRADSVVVLPGRAVDSDVVRRLAWALEDSRVTVGVMTPVSSVSPHRVRTTRLGDRAVVELAPVGASTLEARVKGLIDRFVAALLVLAVAPLLLALIVAVRLDSRGGGLFVQTRVGRHGKTFRMFKLRTMYVDAESMKQALLEDNESDGVLFKIRRDPRVTRVGYWLRRSSLDELPQLLNVLRGDMSLVGPRPALPSEVAAYDDVARRRLVVKPGITGLWQVSGRADLLWEESLRLDIYYTENWRLLDDLGIAARTVGAVTLARGAY